VNPTDSSATLTIPEAVVSFADGSAGPQYAAGQTVTLPARGAVLALNTTFVFGPTGHSS
jgi:hypothetical protein